MHNFHFLQNQLINSSCYQLGNCILFKDDFYIRIDIDKFQSLTIVDENLVECSGCWDKIDRKLVFECCCDISKKSDNEAVCVPVLKTKFRFAKI